MKKYEYPIPKTSEITPKEVYLSRREFMAAGVGAMALGTQQASAQQDTKLKGKKSQYSIDEQPDSLEVITNYNNFYEFGTGKTDPAQYAHTLTTKPWEVEVSGLVHKKGKIDVYDLINQHTLEERIYRLRCVEAWSMVIPWVGIPLAEVIKTFEPMGSAKYVAFETVVRPEEMPGQNSIFGALPWPYVEGLRMDEAMHPLTILAVGLYGDLLPNQNGAPIRLVVPWKYGFKYIKSIVSMKFTEEQPPTSWNMAAPSEYGFYSNVNPNVDHPRWSQKTERIVGQGIFAPRRDTQMFNGYEEQVASMYEGMDLTKFY